MRGSQVTALLCAAAVLTVTAQTRLAQDGPRAGAGVQDVQELAATLEDTQPVRRATAACELGRLGRAAQVAIPALVALLGGATIAKAADDASVDRTTVHRWIRADWNFRASLNRGRMELRDAVQARLLRSAEQAAGIVGLGAQSS